MDRNCHEYENLHLVGKSDWGDSDAERQDVQSVPWILGGFQALLSVHVDAHTGGVSTCLAGSRAGRTDCPIKRQARKCRIPNVNSHRFPPPTTVYLPFDWSPRRPIPC